MAHTIDIPGGTADIFDPDDLTPRRQRPVEELSLQLAGLLTRLENARNVTGAAEANDGDQLGLTGPDVEINERQAHLLAMFSDEVTFMWLKSWTLDLPLPASADGLLDVPGPVVKALSKEAARMQKVAKESNQFDPNEATLNDPASPTGVSGD